MNIFRIAADMSHLVAIIVLLLKIWKSKSCSGVSARSQILLAVVFTSRYMDLFTTYISLYNTFMKIVVLLTNYATLYLMFFKFRSTYISEADAFRVELLILPSAVLAFLVNHVYAPFEILWTFSIYLEAVAILPQIFLLRSTGSAEIITAPYLIALTLYRIFFICNCIFLIMEDESVETNSVLLGVVGTVIHGWFLITYVWRITLKRTEDLIQMVPLRSSELNQASVFKGIFVKRGESTTGLMVHRDLEKKLNVKFKFSVKNMKRVKAIMNVYPEGHKAEALIPLLDLARRQHGWLPVSAMHEIANILEVPRMRASKIAIFYTKFNQQAVGKFILQVCATPSCMLRGAETITETIEKKLGIHAGETTKDGLFTLAEVECLGACVNAPMIQINDDYFEISTPEGVHEILDDLKAERKPVAIPRSDYLDAQQFGICEYNL